MLQVKSKSVPFSHFSHVKLFENHITEESCCEQNVHKYPKSEYTEFKDSNTVKKQFHWTQDKINKDMNKTVLL